MRYSHCFTLFLIETKLPFFGPFTKIIQISMKVLFIEARVAKLSVNLCVIRKYSRTPLFRTRLIRSLRYFEVIFLSLHHQPRYFELVNNRVQEETPKRPTKSKVRQAIETLSHYSLFAVEGAEIRGQTSQLHVVIRQKY